jgi:hypothetical protein
MAHSEYDSLFINMAASDFPHRFIGWSNIIGWPTEAD